MPNFGRTTIDHVRHSIDIAQAPAKNDHRQVERLSRWRAHDCRAKCGGVDDLRELKYTRELPSGIGTPLETGPAPARSRPWPALRPSRRMPAGERFGGGGQDLAMIAVEFVRAAQDQVCRPVEVRPRGENRLRAEKRATLDPPELPFR